MEHGRAPIGDVGMAGGRSWRGERSGLEAPGGSHNVLGTGGGLCGTGGAGRSRPEPRRPRARTAEGSLASDRPTGRSGTLGNARVCSRRPSWVEALCGGGGGDATWTGVRTNASRTRSRPAWVPGSVPAGSWAGEGQTEEESGSRPGSWSAPTAAGVGGGEAAGKEDASGTLRLEADRERSSGRGGTREFQDERSGRAGHWGSPQGEGRRAPGLLLPPRRRRRTPGCGG